MKSQGKVREFFWVLMSGNSVITPKLIQNIFSCIEFSCTKSFYNGADYILIHLLLPLIHYFMLIPAGKWTEPTKVQLIYQWNKQTDESFNCTKTKMLRTCSSEVWIFRTCVKKFTKSVKFKKVKQKKKWKKNVRLASDVIWNKFPATHWLRAWFKWNM